MMTLSNTDFPVPDGPSTAVMAPRGTSKVMSRRTVWDPNDLVRFWMEMTASAGGGDSTASAGGGDSSESACGWAETARVGRCGTADGPPFRSAISFILAPSGSPRTPVRTTGYRYVTDR